ncbi:MAG: hypothetical protein E7540_05330 [Ruminococcaceae bacterium]|nr:hypothetical protein [Oscillospiraceae bacterium]
MRNFFEFIKKLLPLGNKKLSDIKFRTELFLKLGVIINVGFASYNIFTGILYRSVWFGGVAIYYIMLCLIKFFLIYRGFERKAGDIKELYDFRTCSIMLLVLNLTIAILICQMIWQNKSHLYGESVIYVATIFTLFRLSAAIIDTLRLRKFHSPTLYAAKALSLSVALMSFFSLQTALLDRINTDMSVKRGLNIVTGSVVGVTVATIALKSLLKAEKHLKKQ